jgi:hypothetical protein
MGMDVYGKNPTSEVGNYFRRNVWGWHPLWEFVENVHPEIASEVKYAHSNDGDGLDEEKSAELAQLLQQDLVTGVVDVYVRARNEYLASLERHTCEFCEGTGIRSDKVGIENGMPTRKLDPEVAIILGREEGFCNACSGEGKRDNPNTWYQLETDDVKEFSEFLAECGGFEIC